MELKTLKIEPDFKILLISPVGKILTLDFNGDKLRTYGDLKYDEGAKIFFESLDSFFEKAIEKRVKELK